MPIHSGANLLFYVQYRTYTIYRPANIKKKIAMVRHLPFGLKLLKLKNTTQIPTKKVPRQVTGDVTYYSLPVELSQPQSGV